MACDPLQPVSASPSLILPDPSRIFLERSRRLAALAEGHSLAGWLSFLGHLTRIQHEMLKEYPVPLPPDEAALGAALKDRLPPLSAASFPRGSHWRRILAGLSRELTPLAPGPAGETLKALQAMDEATVEILADKVLTGDLDGRDGRYFPFVAAALQVHWTGLAAKLDRARVAPSGTPGVCPCCGYLPVAGIVRTDGEVPRLRYLHCALCNTEWNLVRVTCAACRGNDVAYYHIEGSGAHVRAETCETCRRYLKIVYREKSPQADPVADDLATWALDLLVEEAGYTRMGPNLLLTPTAPPVSEA